MRFSKRIFIQRAYFLISVELGGPGIDESELADILSFDMESSEFEEWLDSQNERETFEIWLKEKCLKDIYESEVER